MAPKHQSRDADNVDDAKEKLQSASKRKGEMSSKTLLYAEFANIYRKNDSEITNKKGNLCSFCCHISYCKR